MERSDPGLPERDPRHPAVIEYVRAEPADVASPCVNTCTLHPATGWCRGCGRSADEIAGWGSRPVADKRAIKARLPGRMATMATRND